MAELQGGVRSLSSAAESIEGINRFTQGDKPKAQRGVLFRSPETRQETRGAIRVFTRIALVIGIAAIIVGSLAVSSAQGQVLPLTQPQLGAAQMTLEQRVNLTDAPYKAQGYPVANIITIKEGPEDAIIGRQDNGAPFQSNFPGLEMVLASMN